ncbi:MAG: DoxX family protein, partial [Opitutaceae bacterium]
LVRMPHTAAFAAKLHRQFAGTLLPPGLVHASAYGIVFAETAIGFLILVGLMLPWALGAGLGLMIVLQFGTALAQDWNVVGLQLIYVALYAALLASVRLDRYSVDGWTRRSNRPGGFTERG